MVANFYKYRSFFPKMWRGGTKIKWRGALVALMRWRELKQVVHAQHCLRGGFFLYRIQALAKIRSSCLQRTVSRYSGSLMIFQLSDYIIYMPSKTIFLFIFSLSKLIKHVNTAANKIIRELLMKTEPQLSIMF